jgi:hypothetical protein
VTEQDVINEDMYEEEDDDLPAQYRRMANILQNQSMRLNDKHESWLLANIGVREAFLHSAARGQLLPQQQFPTTPFFAYNHNQAIASSSVQSSQGPQSPHTMQQYPYSIPNRPFPHQRSASIATPQQATYPANFHPPTSAAGPSGEEQRRMSLPTQSFQSTPQMSPTSEAAQMFNGSVSYNSHQSLFDPMNQQNMNFGPLSPSLPLEQQQMAGGMLDPFNPTTPFLMGGSDAMTTPFSYNYNPNELSKTSEMNQTLTPSALDTTSSMMLPYSNPPSATIVDSLQTTSWDTNQSTWYNENDASDCKAFDMGFLAQHAPESGTHTPTCDFSEFVDYRDQGAA